MGAEHYSVSKTYEELAQEVIEEHEDLHWIRTADVRIDYISSTKKKKSGSKITFAECWLVKELYKLYIPYDFLIVVYEPSVEDMTMEQLKILLYHELLHVGVGERNGEPRYELNPHDIEDFRAVIGRYGIDWANG